MKRHGNLYDNIISFRSLLEASRRARRGKRFANPVARFEYNLENELLLLKHELETMTYRPGPYFEFTIYEPKPRKISAAPFRDRVVQHALCGVIEPIFDRTLISDSYACRTGKGTHRAVARFTEYARKYPYVLKLDISKYFPSIDHALLKALIRRKTKCPKTLWLIDLIIDTSNPQDDAGFHFPGDTLFTPSERERGIPIGNLASQLFANIYLGVVDHFMKARFPGNGYIRYMDDMALFGNSKDELWKACGEIETAVHGMRLRLKPNATMLYPVERGVDFLGYKVYSDHRLLKYENVVKCRRRLKRLTALYGRHKTDFASVRNSIQSWIGHAGYADTWGLRRSLFSKLRLKRDGAKTGVGSARRLLEQ
jgi:retron-type reverse transcriptase